MSSPDQLNTLWNHVAGSLRTRISADAWERWFSHVTLVAASDDAITLHVPDSIHQIWIEMNYLPVLQEAFGAVTTSRHRFHFTTAATGGTNEVPPARRGKSGGKGKSSGPRTLPAAALTPLASTAEIDAEDPVPADRLLPGRTFDTFVIGPSNQFAHAAALAVARSPGRAYNPLFIYGGSGLGKTHLMQAIGAQVSEKRPRSRVVYITSEEFTNQFIHALQTNSIVRFRKRFREADVLLIDDVHFLAGKERSQEEFFHTFNALLDGHKQIVLSSDRTPGEIRNLENRLVTRFEWGHTTALTPPDEETRMAILRNKAATLEIEVPVFVIEYLAEKIRSSVRRLHGALIRVASWISLHGPMTLDQAEELLRDLLQQEARNVMTIDRIQKKVAEVFDIRLGDMVSRRRPANIAFPRQIAMFLSRELTGSSYQEIGSAFGGRDHGTIMHACRLVERRMKTEEELRHMIHSMETALRRSV